MSRLVPSSEMAGPEGLVICLEESGTDMVAPLTQQAFCPQLAGHIFLDGIYVFIKFYGFRITKKYL